jgi:hypothetical protein
LKHCINESYKYLIFLKILDGAVAADAVSAYFAENLDEKWAEIVSTASADCATAVESIATQNITLTKTTLIYLNF